MSQEITLPRVGETVDSVYLVIWLKQVGDQVNEGEDLLEVETDKAQVTVQSPATGKIAQLLFSVDAEIKTGDVIAILE
ncbi:MAG: biotin/lipoyl-binding protein [Actinobacteria bacterium]|nr:biotin/lipoyl-binding protein [Actinomycetota bacterium]